MEDQPSTLEETRAELNALLERFRSIIQRTADGIVVVDAAGRIRFANAAAERLFGRTAENLVGRDLGRVLGVGTGEIDIVRRGEPVVAEFRVMDTDWDGEAARLVSLRDITDRRKAEERARTLLREQLARAEAEEAAERAEFLAAAGRRLSATLDLQTILDHAAGLVVEKLADWCAVDLVEGEASERGLAARRDEHRRALAREAEAYPLSREDGTPRSAVRRECDHRLVDPVTPEWLRQAASDREHERLLEILMPASLVMVPLIAGHQCLGVLTAARTGVGDRFDMADVHALSELGQRVALAVENARLYRDAEAANLSKTNFLSVMSHELRTPLSAIIGYTDLIDRGVAGETTDRQKHFLARIRASSNHLLQIIEEILAFASTEAGEEEVELEETTLGELVAGVSAVAAPLAADSALDFQVDLAEPDARLHTDARKVRQVLLNLLSNALKFTREGRVRLTARVEGDDAVFSVDDTGPGIPEDRLGEIFERFWQAEDPMTRHAGGTGLGLSIARSFARILGGRIDVESVVGEGSTFTVRLPRWHPG